MKKLTKEHKKIYEDVMGRSLDRKELLEIHKDATTPFEVLDWEDRKRKIKLILVLFFIALGGYIL